MNDFFNKISKGGQDWLSYFFNLTPPPIFGLISTYLQYTEYQGWTPLVPAAGPVGSWRWAGWRASGEEGDGGGGGSAVC